MLKATQSELDSELGANFAEFVICLGLLAVVFLAARIYLQTAAEEGLNSSLNVANTTLPCEGGLSTFADGCK